MSKRAESFFRGDVVFHLRASDDARIVFFMKTTQISKTVDGANIIIVRDDKPSYRVTLAPTAPGRDYSQWSVLCSSGGVLMNHLSGKTFKSQKTAEARAIEWLESR